MQSSKHNTMFPLWDFELLLFTHNTCKKDVLSEFSQEEAKYIKDCIELQLKRVLNSENYKDQETTKLLNLIVKVSVHFALSLSGDISTKSKEYITFLQNLYQKNKDSVPRMAHIILLAFYVLQGLFLRENWLGKSFLYHDADYKLKKEAEIKLKKIGMEDRIKQKIIDTLDYNAYFEEKIGHKLQEADLNKYTYDFIKSPELIEHRSESFQQYLTVDGEEIFRRLAYMSLFIIIKEFIKNINEVLSMELLSVNLWSARINFLHNKILNEKLTSLQVDVIKQYNTFFEETGKLLETERDIVACLKVEFGNVLLYYYKYEKSLETFQEAQALRKLNIKFTGKLGYKTKFQTFQTAQLMMEADTMEEGDSKKTIEESKDQEGVPQNVELEEDSIILEKPRLADLNVANLDKEFSVYDQIIVLSLIYHLQKTTPKDDLLQEQVSAYLRGIMDKSQNWLVYSMCLYVRSLNEFQRMKTKERSLLQLQSLVDQFNDKKPATYERIKYYYSLYYPSFLELQRTMAEKYMEIGMVMSSSELFQKLDMLEESVECLAMAGHYEKAKEKALEMIEKKPTAKILCIYGELVGDVSYYQKAWEFSNKRFARAKRSEAKYHFNRNNFEKAIEAFKDSLQVNTYHASSWFTLGCAYLKVNKHQDAVVAFGQVVAIDESQGEGWANLAAAFSVQGKKNEAFNALQQAVKYHEKSWRMWQNLMVIALETKKFKTFLEAVERILKLEQKQIVDKQVLQKVNQVFSFHVEKANIEDTVELGFFKKRITNIYKLMEDKLATQPYFWAQFQEFTALHSRYNERTLELEAELDQRADLEKSYKEHLRARLRDRIPEQDIIEKVADLCMKECHSIMVVGWEEDKRSCEMLLEAIGKTKIAYAKIENDKMHTQLKIFLEANLPRIQKTLA